MICVERDRIHIINLQLFKQFSWNFVILPINIITWVEGCYNTRYINIESKILYFVTKTWWNPVLLQGGDKNCIVLELVTNLKYPEAYICLYSSPYKEGFKTFPHCLLFYILCSYQFSIQLTKIFAWKMWWLKCLPGDPPPPKKKTKYSRQKKKSLFMYIQINKTKTCLSVYLHLLSLWNNKKSIYYRKKSVCHKSLNCPQDFCLMWPVDSLALSGQVTTFQDLDSYFPFISTKVQP